MRLKKAEQEFIALERVARLATVDREGTPHNVPICHALARGRIYFASAKDGKKVRNIREHPTVALTFDACYAAGHEKWAIWNLTSPLSACYERTEQRFLFP